MRISIDARQLGNGLRLCSIDDSAVKIKTLNNSIRLFAVAHDKYIEQTISADVIEPGEEILDKSLIPYCLAAQGPLMLDTKAGTNLVTNNMHITIPSLSMDLDMIRERTIPSQDWHITNVRRLSNIIYATGNDLFGRDVIWVCDGLFVCGDGPRLALYKTNEESSHQITLRASSVVDNCNVLFEEFGTWFCKDDTNLYLPAVVGEIPSQVKILSQNKELLFSQHDTFAFNKADAVNAFSLARIATTELANRLGLCKLSIHNSECQIDFDGQHQGSLSLELAQGLGELELNIKPGYLLDALRNCESDTVYFGINNLFGIDILSINDGDIVHLISPLSTQQKGTAC